MEFVQSFMRFSFSDDSVFMIESDPVVTQAQGVKTCECIVLINEHVALIEAKSSSPRPENKENFDVWIEGIKDKFSDSLSMFNKIKGKEFGETAYNRIPIKLREMSIVPDHYVIYLIVHDNKLEWMIGIQNALREAMRDVIDQWNLQDSNIKAINDVTAKEMHLIVEVLPRK